MWKEMLENVLEELPGASLKSPQPAPGLVGGKWGWMDKRYILEQICGTAPSTIGICQ